MEIAPTENRHVLLEMKRFINSFCWYLLTGLFVWIAEACAWDYRTI
jgi:hypothetical protein